MIDGYNFRRNTDRQIPDTALYIEGYRDESMRTLEKPTRADDERLVQEMSGVSHSCLIDWIVFHKTMHLNECRTAKKNIFKNQIFYIFNYV